MKKIICLILTLIFVLCSVGYYPMAAETGDELSEATAIFEALGVKDSDEDLTKALNRADFAFKVAQFLGVNVHEIDSRSFFADVPDTLWSKTAINYLAEHNYISGADGNFYPEREITAIEAIKVLLSLAGYNAEADQRGGYPNGYLLTATRLKITDSIPMSKPLSVGDFRILLYRICQLNYMSPQGIEGGNVIYSSKNTETVLGFYHNVYYTSGRIEAAGYSAISRDSSCESDEVIIDGQVYKNPGEKIDFYSHLGHETEVYYKKLKDKPREIVCVLETTGTNQIITIYSKDFIDVKDNGGYYTIRYYNDNGKEKSIRVDRGAVIIENGQSIDEDIEDALDLEHGYMTLMKLNGSSICNVARIYDGDDVVIGNINNQNTDEILSMHSNGGYYYMRAEVGGKVIIYDKYNSELMTDISASDGRTVRLRNSNGMTIGYDDLSVEDVVTIYESDDGTHVELVKGMGSITGTIDSLSASGEVTIGDNTYKITPTCLENHKYELKPGAEGKFILNCFGDIAYMTVTSNSSKLAFLVSIDYNNKGLNNSLKVKLFTVDNEMKIFDVAENVQIDGKPEKGYAAVAEKLHGEDGNLLNTMICFGTNAEGKVNYIDFPIDVTDDGNDDANDGGDDDNYESEDTLIKTGYHATATYYSSAKKFNNIPTAICNSTQTKVFVIPIESTLRNGTYEDDWFKAYSLSNIDFGNSSYEITTYKIGLRSPYEHAVVLRKDDQGVTAASASTVLLIEKVYRGLNKDGEEVNVIKAYSTGRTVGTYYTTDLSVLSGYDIKKGDLVYFRVDIQGRLKACGGIIYSAKDGNKFENKEDFTIGYNKDTKKINFPASTSISRYEYAHAAEVSGSVLRYGKLNIDSTTGETSVTADNACIIPDIIYVIDTTASAEPNVYVGAKSEIADHIRAGSECSEMILRSSVCKVNQIYIYK